MSEAPAHIGMVAGEASGDLLAAHLIGALASRRPELRFSGIGGPRMATQGFEAMFPVDSLAVRGYAEVLRHYRRILAMRRDLVRRLLERKPALFIGVDSSDFNLAIERTFKDAGIPAIQYVGPQIWAWRGWRMRRIRRSVTHVLALFPFEPALYEKAGVPVTYVGHPLADDIPVSIDKSVARSQLRLPPGRRIVALLPGSRIAELQYMAELFVKAARRMADDIKNIHFVCPSSSRATRDLLDVAIRKHWPYGGDDPPITLMFGHSHEALAAADVALVASGTATLETALFKTPMVVTYRMSPVTWALTRHMMYLPHVALPNILAGQGLVPEYLQDKATPEALASALSELLLDNTKQRTQVEGFREIHLKLRQGTAAKAADAVLGVLDRGRA